MSQKLSFAKNLLTTRCKTHLLFVAEFSLCKKQSYLILVEKVVIWKKNHSLLVTKVALYEKSLVPRFKVCLILVAEVAHHKNHLLHLAKFACYWLQNLLAACFRGGVTFYNFVKKLLQHRKFFCQFLRKFKNTYSVEHLQTTVSENDRKTSINF